MVLFPSCRISQLAGLWVARYLGTDDLSEQTQYLAWFRMPALHGLLGEDEIVIHFDLERSAARGDIGKRFDYVLIIGQ